MLFAGEAAAARDEASIHDKENSGPARGRWDGYEPLVYFATTVTVKLVVAFKLGFVLSVPVTLKFV